MLCLPLLSIVLYHHFLHRCYWSNRGFFVTFWSGDARLTKKKRMNLQDGMVSYFGKLQCTPTMAKYEALENFHSLGGSIVLIVSRSQHGKGGLDLVLCL